MNQILEIICNRRSIRKFKQRKVDEKIINEIIQAAMNAPSACNQQIWHFVILDDKNKLQKLSTMHSGISFLNNAPLAIIVCGEPGAAILDYFWEDDCAAATQNILLAVHILDLGATWSGINRKSPDMVEFVQNAVEIPNKYIPFSVIAIGYPDEEKPFQNRFNSEKIHLNNW